MGAAARHVHVSQPALTRAVRRLEAELGVTLFERSGRNVVLAPGAERVVDSARRICAEVDRLQGRTPGGTSALVVSSTPTVATWFTERVVPNFVRARPDVRIQMLLGDGSDGVEGSVRSGRAEIGLMDRPAGEGLVSRSLSHAELVLVSPHTLELPDPLPVRVLNTVPMIVPAAGSVRRADCDRLFGRLGVDPPVVLETNDRNAWSRAVASGVGSSITFATTEALSPGTTVRQRRFDPPILIPLHVTHGHSLSEAATAFLAAADEAQERT